MKERAEAATANAGVLRACLRAWERGEDDIDAEAGALVVADTIILWRKSLTGK